MKTRWHGTWRGQRTVQLEVDDLDIEEDNVCVYSTERRGNSPIPERIFVVTGPSRLHIANDIIDWAKARGIEFV